jgi:hypothetical protein
MLGTLSCLDRTAAVDRVYPPFSYCRIHADTDTQTQRDTHSEGGREGGREGERETCAEQSASLPLASSLRSTACVLRAFSVCAAVDSACIRHIASTHTQLSLPLLSA